MTRAGVRSPHFLAWMGGVEGGLFRAEPLHDAGVGLSLLVLLGGGIALARRLAAAWRRGMPLVNLQVPRMLAVLGALGAYVAYLRDLGTGHGSRDLTLAGVSALPWALVIGLELVRRWIRTSRSPRGGRGRE